MPFWVYGRDATTGQPREPLFIEVESEADARQQAADAGMTVEEVESVRPPEPETKPEAPAPPGAPRCARCGSDRVVPRAAVWDQGRYSSGTLQVYVEANPGAFLFRGTTYATLHARVCAACGYTELFADGAEGLYQAYRKSQIAEPT
jgi:hypothetical protein